MNFYIAMGGEGDDEGNGREEIMAAEIRDRLGGILRKSGSRPLKRLTADEERKIVEAAQQGDEEAKQILAEIGFHLIVNVASKYARPDHPTLSLEDLVQEGYIGFYRGISKWRASMGHRLSTYVLYWIRQSILRAVANTGQLVRSPLHRQKLWTQIRKASNKLTIECGRKPTDEELAGECKLTLPQLYAVWAEQADYKSLDEPVFEDCGPLRGDSILGTEIDPERAVELTLLRENIEEALAILKPREQAILRMRFGLDDGDDRTLEEIAQHFGLSRERIRQIEAKAFAKLRKPEVKKHLFGNAVF